jgi:LPS-assembly lipoprotein
MSSSDGSDARGLPACAAGRRSALRRLRAGAALAALAFAAAGCGFALRHAEPVPFQRIALRGFAPRSPMQAELQRALSQVCEVVPDEAQAQVVLSALTDTRDQVVVATTAAGQVRELTLRVRLKFRVETPAGRELLAPDERMLSRDVSYNETNALAKEQEEDQLYRALQSDIVAQVMQQLSAIQLP